MPKFKIEKRKFFMDGVDISDEVAAVNISMNPQATELVLVRFARTKDGSPIMDDAGPCVFASKFINPDIDLQHNGIFLDVKIPPLRKG